MFFDSKPNIGVSSCLLGEAVRFNGGHSRARFVTDVLDKVFNWVPFCPEMEAGMGTPREAVRLVGDEESPRVIGSNTGRDWTVEVRSAAEHFLRLPAARTLHGFILKKKSPSCGMERVPLYKEDGNKKGTSMGVFAAALKKAYPLMPMEEEGRLNDPRLRENFAVRVYAFKAWRDLLSSGVSPARLVEFHARQKMLLIAHHPGQARKLGKLVALAGKEPLSPLVEQYGKGFMACLALSPRMKYHVQVLQRFLGFLKNHLSPSDRSELHDCVEQYRGHLVPLSVPLTLLKHHLRKNPHPWANQQTYLAPFPRQLPLRNYMEV
ncbi:MAG: DUF523 and DUF1722 domain-containing protein [Acidobacteriota bacterium]|nr:DUF523 and DUF1722 domain-containing protein [Acidobacteriota bacterium]